MGSNVGLQRTKDKNNAYSIQTKAAANDLYLVLVHFPRVTPVLPCWRLFLVNVTAPSVLQALLAPSPAHSALLWMP